MWLLGNLCAEPQLERAEIVINTFAAIGRHSAGQFYKDVLSGREATNSGESRDAGDTKEAYVYQSNSVSPLATKPTTPSQFLTKSISTRSEADRDRESTRWVPLHSMQMQAVSPRGFGQTGTD